MRTWEVIAFIVFICAALAAYLGHKLALVLIAVGLACMLVPAVFQLT